MNKKYAGALAISIIVCEFAGLLGTLFTIQAIPTWYTTLTKPPLNPPSWIFGPVWTTLYILMGLAAFLVWATRNNRRRESNHALGIFGIQLALNALWSVLFFGLHNPLLGLIEIILMWIAIIWTIVVFYKISRPAAYLLLPYIAWVSFATYLNAGIWVLNR